MEDKNKQGGKRAGSGRKKRTTAVRKTVLIETASVEYMETLGKGYIGRGIDQAVIILKKLKKPDKE